MALKIYKDLEQGTDEWFQARCGVLTASLIGKLLTKTCSAIAKNDTAERVILDILGQRVNGIGDESFQTFAMQRGHEDEMEAKILYSKHVAPVSEIGFMTNDKWGFTLGYSPDGLVGEDGLIECKSRLSGLQMQTICSQNVPIEYMPQIQTGLMVSGRRWLDFISFPALGGGKMMVKRVYSDPKFQALLLDAAAHLEAKIKSYQAEYEAALHNPDLRLIDTERRENPEEIMV
ncbi:lambda exonuclease family protein [Acetobacter sp. AC2005]|uniref:lambda exonuclease family protein n=1 Tax=Acetobacter sp. AC2005 TaxID=3134142 RepID=UPI0030CDBB2C